VRISNDFLSTPRTTNAFFPSFFARAPSRQDHPIRPFVLDAVDPSSTPRRPPPGSLDVGSRILVIDAVSRQNTFSDSSSNATTLLGVVLVRVRRDARNNMGAGEKTVVVVVVVVATSKETRPAWLCLLGLRMRERRHQSE
jgi:hypothetical protein